MQRSNDLSIILLLLSICWSPSPVGAADRPNFIILLADDCTYLDMQVYGGQAKTPNLNKLAAEGMVFHRCFQAAPMCSPTRHNLYTGIYPVKSGAWPNHTRVYPGTKSIAHYLNRSGYRTALSGKTHIGPKESFPFEYSKEFRSADPLSENPYPVLSSWLDECIQDNTPFCLFACSNEPHSPFNKGDATDYPADALQLPPSWVDTPETRSVYSRYLAEITYFDAQCGRLMKMIDQKGLRNNTLVLVLSEQGSQFPFAKWTCYEMGLASGMIARWPGRIEPGRHSDALVEYCDVTPTLLRAADIEVPAVVDGKSFLQVLQGTRLEHKTYTFGIQTTRGISNGSEAFGIRSCATKTHRYIRNLNPDQVFRNVIIRPKPKGTSIWNSWERSAKAGNQHALQQTERFRKRPPEELYDVQSDPHCMKNLIDKPDLQELRYELSRQLDAWMKQQGDQGRQTEAIAHTRQSAFIRNQKRNKAR